MKQFRFKTAIWLSTAVLGFTALVCGEGKAAEQFVFVGGEVKDPGPKIFTNGMTTLDAIRMAKGVTGEASATNVVFQPNHEKSIVLNRQDIEDGKVTDVKLHEGDRIIVPHK